MPVTAICNTTYVVLDTVLLRQQMDAMRITMRDLRALTGYSLRSVQRWALEGRAVPWYAVCKIADVTSLQPQRLAIPPKKFDPAKLDYYLRRRRQSINALIRAGRFLNCAGSSVSGWRVGSAKPTLATVRMLERGLGLECDALTDGPLKEVPVFTDADMTPVDATGAMDQAAWAAPARGFALQGGASDQDLHPVPVSRAASPPTGFVRPLLGDGDGKAGSGSVPAQRGDAVAWPVDDGRGGHSPPPLRLPATVGDAMAPPPAGAAESPGALDVHDLRGELAPRAGRIQ